MLYQIVYVSASHGALAEDQVTEILEQSRRNNAEDGISGLLFYHDGLFCQVIEGERARVETCYARILKDPRHREVSLIWENDIEARAFPDWTMGYKKPADLGDENMRSVLSLADIQRKLGANLISDPIVSELIRSILGSFSELE